MSYEECKTCHECGWTDEHRCKPEYQVILIDYNDPEDPSIVHAGDCESAALKYAMNNFSNWDYPNEMEIWARKSDCDEWQRFSITVEAVPEFSATKLP